MLSSSIKCFIYSFIFPLTSFKNKLTQFFVFFLLPLFLSFLGFSSYIKLNLRRFGFLLLYIKTTSLPSSLLSFIHLSRCCSPKTDTSLSLSLSLCDADAAASLHCCWLSRPLSLFWVCSLFYLIESYLFAENT